jgi:hypothetical protein
MWSEEKLAELERRHPEGVSVQAVVDLFAESGEHLTEATFRKYVQLGLLPRSVRVGRKGKHRGSQGLYPVSAIRQIAALRQLMGQGFTLDEIQKNFLFVRGDIEALDRQLDRVFRGIESAQDERSRSRGGDDQLALRMLSEARALAGDLMGRLASIEQRLSFHARMARAAV